MWLHTAPHGSPQLSGEAHSLRAFSTVSSSGQHDGSSLVQLLLINLSHARAEQHQADEAQQEYVIPAPNTSEL